MEGSADGQEAERLWAIVAELTAIRDNLIETSLMLQDARYELERSRGGLPPPIVFPRSAGMDVSAGQPETPSNQTPEGHGGLLKG